MSVETFGGQVVYTKDITSPKEPGYGKEKLSLKFPLVGNFRASVFSAAGDLIGVSGYGHMFSVHPVMKDGFGNLQPGDEEDDFQGILYSRDGKVYQLPAERTRLPLFAGEGGWNFTITVDNKIYLMVRTGTNDVAQQVMHTGDGGQTWDKVKVTRSVNSVLRDGTFLSYDHENDHLLLYRSQDEGQTWECLGSGLRPLPSPPQSGPITQLRDGTLV